MKNYNTKQKEIVLDAIKHQKKEFNSKDIYLFLNKKVGLTTIYRKIDVLLKENKIIKTTNVDNTTYYQYKEECCNENHFYLKCKKCGSLIHIDCDCINDLNMHIKNNHNFILDKENIIINGTCKKCSEV